MKLILALMVSLIVAAPAQAFDWKDHPILWKSTAIVRKPYNLIKSVAKKSADETTSVATTTKKSSGWVCDKTGIKWLWEKFDQKLQVACKRVEPYNGGLGFISGMANLWNATNNQFNRK